MAARVASETRRDGGEQLGFDPMFTRDGRLKTPAVGTENIGDQNGAKEAEYHAGLAYVKAEGRVTPWRRKTGTRGANYCCLGDSTALLTLMTLHFMGPGKDNYPPNLSVRQTSLPPLSVSFEAR